MARRRTTTRRKLLRRKYPGKRSLTAKRLMSSALGKRFVKKKIPNITTHISHTLPF